MSRSIRSFSTLLFSGGIAFAMITGCGNSHATGGTPSGSSGTGSSGAFSVGSIMPASGATGVALNSTIQIAFSSGADTSSVNTTDIKVTDPQAVAGAVTYNSTTNVATFTPSAALSANTTYTVTVSGVTSSSGAALASPFLSTFTTIAGSTSSGGGSGTPTMQFEASLFQGNTVLGQVSIDTTGLVTIQFTGSTAGASLPVQFCPAYYTGSTPPACFAVGTVTANSSGDGDATLQFPDAGNWSGDFQVGSGNTGYSTGLFSTSTSGAAAEVYMAALLPQTTTNAGTFSGGTQDSISSGTITFSNNLLTFTLNGVPASTSFQASENSNSIGGSESYVLDNSSNQDTFTSSSKGALTFIVKQDGNFGDIFQVDSVAASGQSQQNNGVGYLGGFSVPE